MWNMYTQKSNFGRANAGFTLMELLTVIAVIAILAAIIFPVFGRVRESARQKTAISNLSAISGAIGLYRLDHGGKPPDVLFGYNTGGSMESVRFVKPQVGLFPSYIHDTETFTDPNNNVDDPSVATGPLIVNSLGVDGTLSTGSRTFYAADAYDVSPEVLGTNDASSGTYVPRYQSSWTSVSAVPTVPPAGVSVSDYQRQMRFLNPPGDTFVTCDTYHVNSADKVIILYASGGTRTMNSSLFLVPGPDVAALSVTAGVTNASFWKLHQ